MLHAIETEGLTKRFGNVTAVDDLTLNVELGSVFGFIGPNGAGKSTTIKLLLDALRPSSGTARVLGLDTHQDMIEIHRRCGYLPGELHLPKDLTGREFVDFLTSLRGPIDHAVVADLVDRFSVDLDRKMRNLSTGNKRKIGLVQAFMHQPDLVLLDEPTSGIDPLIQHEFQEFLAAYCAEGGTAFLSSHTLSEVQRVADRVGIIRDGALVALEEIDSLLSQINQELVITFADMPDQAAFDRVSTTNPQIQTLKIEGEQAHISFRGDLDPVLRAALDMGSISHLQSQTADLERVFLQYYEDQKL